jgi:hypothetical protein
MAKFIFVRDREGIGYYVNVDLVQAVEEIPDSKRWRAGAWRSLTSRQDGVVAYARDRRGLPHLRSPCVHRPKRSAALWPGTQNLSCDHHEALRLSAVWQPCRESLSGGRRARSLAPSDEVGGLWPHK